MKNSIKYIVCLLILAGSFGCRKNDEFQKPSIERTENVNSKSGDLIYQCLEQILINEETSQNGFSYAPIPCNGLINDEPRDYIFHVESNVCPSHEIVVEISICGVPYSVHQISLGDGPISIPFTVPCGCDFTVQMYSVDMNNGIKCKQFGSATGTLYLTN